MKKWAVLFFLLSSCTNAECAQVSSLGAPGHVRCYSGGTLIYEGTSTGKILTEEHSDGWYFEDVKTRRLVRVSADCIIEN